MSDFDIRGLEIEKCLPQKQDKSESTLTDLPADGEGDCIRWPLDVPPPTGPKDAKAIMELIPGLRQGDIDRLADLSSGISGLNLSRPIYRNLIESVRDEIHKIYSRDIGRDIAFSICAIYVDEEYDDLYERYQFNKILLTTMFHELNKKLLKYVDHDPYDDYPSPPKDVLFPDEPVTENPSPDNDPVVDNGDPALLLCENFGEDNDYFEDDDDINGVSIDPNYFDYDE